jgi:plastocyanin
MKQHNKTFLTILAIILASLTTSAQTSNCFSNEQIFWAGGNNNFAQIINHGDTLDVNMCKGDTIQMVQWFQSPNISKLGDSLYINYNGNIITSGTGSFVNYNGVSIQPSELYFVDTVPSSGLYPITLSYLTTDSSCGTVFNFYMNVSNSACLSTDSCTATMQINTSDSINYEFIIDWNGVDLDSSVGASSLWFGDGNSYSLNSLSIDTIPYTYSNTGTYNIQFSYSQFNPYTQCFNSDSVEVISNFCDTILSNFSHIVSGNTVTFANNVFCNPIYNAEFWDFGDGNSQQYSCSGSSGFTYTYPNPGTYTACLTYHYQDPFNFCLDTSCTTITVPGGAYDSCTATLQINTTDSINYEFVIDWNGVDLDSVSGGGFLWFGDGNSYNLNSLTIDTVLHTYSSSGIYNIQFGYQQFNPYTQCSNFDSVSVISNFCDTIVSNFGHTISGNTVTFTNNSYCNPTYNAEFWDFGDGNTQQFSCSGPSGFSYTYPNPGTYSACLVYHYQDPVNHCFDTSCVSITVPGSLNDSVWPGDANSDGVANLFDVLPIGLAYGSTGPVRAGASLLWVGQPATDWASSFGSGVNYKHADCNGDGIVNINDVPAILLNYGQTHTKGEGGAKSNVDLYLEASVDTTTLASPVTVSVKLGTSLIQADSIHGIVFSFEYENDLIDTGSMQINYNNSWLGNIQNNNDMIALDTNFKSSAVWEIGITRTDQVHKGGFGEIASIDIVTVDDLSGLTAGDYEILNLNLSYVLAIDQEGNAKALNWESDSVYIGLFPNSVDQSVSKVIGSFYPNPTTQIIKYKGQIDDMHLQVLNGIGQVMLDRPHYSGEDIDVSKLPAGAYFINMNKGTEILTKKMLKL